MTVYYYNITNNTGSPIRLPSNQLVDATSTTQITLLEFRTYCEQDDEFLEYVANGDLSVSFGAGQESVRIAEPSDGVIEVLKDTDKIVGVEVDDLSRSSDYFLTYRGNSGKVEYKPVAEFDYSAPDSTSSLWIDLNHYLICFYDRSREKWLATVKNVYAYGSASLTRNSYLNVSGVSPASASVGYYIFRYGTVTGVFCKVASMTGATDPYFDVRTIEDGTIYSFAVDPGQLYYLNNDLNIDLDKGRLMQVYARDRFVDPVVQVEVSWRCGI